MLCLNPYKRHPGYTPGINVPVQGHSDYPGNTKKFHHWNLLKVNLINVCQGRLKDAPHDPTSHRTPIHSSRGGTPLNLFLLLKMTQKQKCFRNSGVSPGNEDPNGHNLWAQPISIQTCRIFMTWLFKYEVFLDEDYFTVGVEKVQIQVTNESGDTQHTPQPVLLSAPRYLDLALK